jgi:hypothetical protein
MRIFLVSLAMAASVTAVRAQTPAPAAGQAADGHVLVTPGDIKWAPAPPGVPPGAFVAVMDGDPSKPGQFTIRLKMPAGYKVAPHWHPTDEHVRIRSGQFLVGMGDALDATKTMKMAPGDTGSIGAKMNHFAIAPVATVLSIRSEGPFAMTYVNAADDPRKPGEAGGDEKR